MLSSLEVTEMTGTQDIAGINCDTRATAWTLCYGIGRRAVVALAVLTMSHFPVEL